MKRKSCNTRCTQCIALNSQFARCDLGYKIKKVKTTKVDQGCEYRYYSPIGECQKPKSFKEYVDMKLFKEKAEKQGDNQ